MLTERPIPDHDTDTAHIARTRGRELRWTEAGSPWVEPVCAIEPVDAGVGGRWGRKPRKARTE